MGKKITISIQEDLHSEMEKWRESFNFSRVFQEAIREKIQQKESFQERLRGDFDIEKTIVRLREEKLGDEKYYYEAGMSEGLEWAKVASYKDLQSVRRWSPKDGFPIPIDDGEDISTDYENYFSEVGGLENLITSFWTGWADGVREFWNQVEDKL